MKQFVPLTTAYRDSALIRRIKKGDKNAFALLMSHYQHKIHAMGYSFFKNTTDADDFVQDVFFKLYTRIESFRGESQFSTWFMRIAYNQAVNTIKRRKSYASLAENFDQVDLDYGPEEKQIQKATVQAVRDAIKELPENYKVCVDMYFFYDFPYNEISVITGLPVNTIKSNVFRAKKILKTKLETIQEDSYE